MPAKRRIFRKAVGIMEKANIETLVNIFKALTTEMPEELLYRENGSRIELRIPDGASGTL